jgi:hypothetical protein
MKVTLDRIEEGMAVLLIRDGKNTKIVIPLDLTPEGSREGDILDLSISRDLEATDEAKKRVSGLIEKLRNQNK